MEPIVRNDRQVTMSAMRCRLVLVLGALVMFGTSCGGGSGGGADSRPISSVDSPTTTSGGEEVGRVRVRVIGDLVNGSICPGGQRPCLPLSGGSEELDGTVLLMGSIIRDVVEIEFIEQHEYYSKVAQFADRCEGKIPGETDIPLIEAVNAYSQSIPEKYATTWSSPSEVIHLGVIGDPAPHEEALTEMGLESRVCVVGGSERSDAELEVVQDEVGDVVREWADVPDVGISGWGRDHFRGAVVIELFRMDLRMRTAVAERFGDVVVFDAALEVLNGDLAEFDSRFGADGPAAAEPQVQMACGAVTFDGNSFDFDSFPVPDADLIAVLVAGFGRGGGFGDVENMNWSIASSDGSSIGVVGRGDTDPPSFLYAVVDRSGDTLDMTSYGQCNLEVTAVGLGSAVMILDPDKEPNPAASSLSVLIMERRCASGQSPERREVIPVVNETDTEVQIVVLVAPVKGGATCPGNPWYPVEITLEQPLGDRKILDARTIPPVQRTWPPTADELNG